MPLKFWWKHMQSKSVVTMNHHLFLSSKKDLLMTRLHIKHAKTITHPQPPSGGLGRGTSSDISDDWLLIFFPPAASKSKFLFVVVSPFSSSTLASWSNSWNFLSSVFKGQIMSEGNFGVLNFQKNNQNFLKDFCPSL